MNYKKSALMSVSIHALLFLSLNLKMCGGAGGDGDDLAGRKGSDYDAVIKILPKIPTNSHGEPCEKSYGGIGVLHDTVGMVEEVPPGNPAYLAGVKKGDLIVYPDIFDIRGEVGTSVTIHILRDGVTLQFTMIRGKICEGT